MKGMNIKDLEKEGYKEIEKIDLVNNKKEAMLVNILGFVIVVVMMVFIPLLIKAGFIRSYKDNLILSLIVFSISLILYIPLHEIVHGVVLKCYTNEKLSFGWKFVYAYCGSKEAVVKRGEYYFVALAPPGRLLFCVCSPNGTESHSLFCLVLDGDNECIRFHWRYIRIYKAL